MSLRRDIHTAFEVIAPPLGGMPERVVQTVLADKRRRRNSRMLLPLRAPLPLVAALVAIALVAAVLVGGRIVQDWNALQHGSPAGHSQLTPLQQLEARPLNLPTYRTAKDCKGGPYDSQGRFLAGPLHADGGPEGASPWGAYYSDTAYSDIQIAGPILVRAQDVVTGKPVVFIGRYAAGPVIGTDTYKQATVQQHAEAVLDSANASPVTSTGGGSKGYYWTVTAGVPDSWSGSTGWQFDAQGFSAVFLAC